MNKKLIPFLCVIIGISTVKASAAPNEKEALAAMKKASAFMMDTVSTRGGFVWNYTSDLSERWGEVPARDSQIWVQGATNGVGEMFIDAYEATGDDIFLDYAERVADAIIRGQHPAGGWHYLIDFDMPGIRRWYDEVATRCWGWEEYYHYYGNCTFDDNATASSTHFLLRLYMTTLDPAYRTPLLKALDFVLEAQFPNGAWPQRYPLMFDYPHNGHDDYTSYYTFNDGVIPNNLYLLMEAYEKLGDERYYTAARRAMDFYIISQGPDDQAGWAQQYSWDMQPAAARSYEPAAYQPGRTMYSINDLMTFYKITGDRRYLAPILPAIDWIERSAINRDPSKTASRTGRRIHYTHARFYEPGTNKPLIVHREGTSIENGRYYADQNIEDPMCHLGMFGTYDTDALRSEYERVSALTPSGARAEYDAERTTLKPVPEVTPDEVDGLIKSLDDRGAWITEISIPCYADPCDQEGRRIFEGIGTREFQRNMTTLINYYRSR